ncbi:MAG: hypothetical protein J1E81_10120 [Eubacterium sp.]|nr:hypothetical protein [Eubacterium sp.]
MKKKAILFTALAAICAVIVLIIVGYTAVPKGPIKQLKEYLEQNNYSCSKYTCTMQSERVNDDITEKYTEVYRFKENTFTATWTEVDSSDTAIRQMEFIYNYADNTVTMNRYETADSCKTQVPDTVCFMNNEEILECIQGDLTDSNSELCSQILSFKDVFKQHLEGAGVTVQDITL